MKVVILAGGFGTRLSEETNRVPKPMVEIGGRPILWHIMKYYSYYGFKEFIIALGYKGEIIKEFFLNYYTLQGDMTIYLKNGKIKNYNNDSEDWIIHLIDTGLHTSTGGRLKRLESWLKNEKFMLTYGDGLTNLNLHDLSSFHCKWKRMATVTAVRPPARFGGLLFEGDLVSEFTEKPQIGEGWINGGFMVFEPEIFEYIYGDETRLEQDVLEKLACDRQLVAYKHTGFWQCMDTLRDVRLLEDLWNSGKAPWRVWKS